VFATITRNVAQEGGGGEIKGGGAPLSWKVDIGTILFALYEARP